MESDISGLLNFPDLKIPQVFELDDIFCFCQDIPTFLIPTKINDGSTEQRDSKTIPYKTNLDHTKKAQRQKAPDFFNNSK
jgi:hypothetical protein